MRACERHMVRFASDGRVGVCVCVCARTRALYERDESFSDVYNDTFFS